MGVQHFYLRKKIINLNAFCKSVTQSKYMDKQKSDGNRGQQ